MYPSTDKLPKLPSFSLARESNKWRIKDRDATAKIYLVGTTNQTFSSTLPMKQREHSQRQRLSKAIETNAQALSKSYSKKRLQLENCLERLIKDKALQSERKK